MTNQTKIRREPNDREPSVPPSQKRQTAGGRLRERLGLVLLSGLSLLGLGMAYWLEEWLVAGLFGCIVLGVCGLGCYRLAVRMGFSGFSSFFAEHRGHRLVAGRIFTSGTSRDHENGLKTEAGREASADVRTGRLSSRRLSFRMKWNLEQGVQLGGKLLFLLVVWSLFAVGVINVRQDWTRERVFSLSSRSSEILASVDEEVTILYFAVPTRWNDIDQLLRVYADKSPYISYRWVDMTQEQALVREYDIRREETLVFYRNAAPSELFKAFKEDLRPLGSGARQHTDNISGAALVTRIYNYEGVINETLLALRNAGVRRHVYFLKTEQNILQWSSQDRTGYSYLASNLERLGYQVAYISLEALLRGGNRAERTTEGANERRTNRADRTNRTNRTTKRTDRAIGATIDKTAERIIDKKTEKTTEKTTEKATEKKIEKTTEGAIEKTTEESLEKPPKKSSSEPVVAASKGLKADDILYLSEADLLRLDRGVVAELMGENSVLERHFENGGGLVVVAATSAEQESDEFLQIPSSSPLSRGSQPKPPEQVVTHAKSPLVRSREQHLAAFYRQFSMRAPLGIVVDTENFHPVLGQKLYETRGQLLTDFPFITYHKPHPITATLAREKLTPFLLTPETLEPIIYATEAIGKGIGATNIGATNIGATNIGAADIETPKDSEPANRIVTPNVDNTSPNNNNSWERTVLLKSGERAWLEKDYFTEIREAGNPRYHFGTDVEGEQHVAWSLTHAQTSARVVFIGDATFFENDLITLFGNRDFMLNALLWAGGADTLLGTGYQTREEALFLPTRQAVSLFLLIFIVGFPLAFLGLGFYVIVRNNTRAYKVST